MNISNRTTRGCAQGSQEWHALRTDRFTASEAPAMLGVSKYQTRNDLLKAKFTRIVDADVDPATLRRFAEGHAAEAQARPIVEGIIGQELFPVTMTAEIEGLPLLASMDGLTMLGDIGWETKLLNLELRDAVQSGTLPEHYTAQMEQQLMVSGAERIYFTASDGTQEGTFGMWYESDPALRSRIIAGWKQFAADLAAYTLPDAEAPEIVAEPVQALPAVFVQVSGSLAVAENFAVFETALRKFLDERLIRDPQTDQDFADLDLQIKALQRAEEALNAAEAQMLAQVSSVDAAKRAKDALYELTRKNRLMAEKLLKSEKERRREEKIVAARAAFAAHVDALLREITGLRLDVSAPDFAVAIKGLKTLASIQDKLDTALANGKIEAGQKAADLRIKMAWVNANAANHRALLADLQQLSAKPLDDFTLAITARIDAHKKAEAERLEAERARIRAEEEAKANAEVEAKLALAAAAQKAEAENVQLDAPAPTASRAAFARTASPGAADSPPTLRLGQINERLAPVSLTADGLSHLGFPHAATDKAAKLYHERDFPRMCAALVRHIQSVQVTSS